MDVPARTGRGRVVITGSAALHLAAAEGNGHTQVAGLLRQAVRDIPEAAAV
jgi:hypothetical protein